jgi:hypothetical protein
MTSSNQEIKINIKALPILFALIGGGCTPLISTQDTLEANEIRRIHFAERVAFIEQARLASPVIREIRERCQGTCPQYGTEVELAIGTIGIGKSTAAADALINFIGLSLDGSAGEELSCQLFINGRTILERLERTQAKAIVDHCRSTFHELQKHELKGIAEQTCRTEDKVREEQNAILDAIKLDSFSDWQECFHQVSADDQQLITTQNAFATTTAANEARQIRFAETNVIIKVAKDLVPSIQEARKLGPCPETRIIELAIGTIGISKSSTAADALVNLLGVNLDEVAFRELRCQILVRGDALSARLESVHPEKIVEHCQSTLHESHIGIEANQACRSEVEILSKRDEMLDAIKSKAACEPL